MSSTKSFKNIFLSQWIFGIVLGFGFFLSNFTNAQDLEQIVNPESKNKSYFDLLSSQEGFNFKNFNDSENRHISVRDYFTNRFAISGEPTIVNNGDVISIKADINNNDVIHKTNIILSLIKIQDGFAGDIVDRVYVDNFVLNHNDNTITYNYKIPKFLTSGEYALQFDLIDKSGAEEVILFLGKVSISKKVITKDSYPKIDQNNCYILIDDKEDLNKDNIDENKNEDINDDIKEDINKSEYRRYNFSEGVDVSAEESLTVYCPLKDKNNNISDLTSSDYIISYFNSTRSFGAEDIRNKEANTKKVKIKDGILSFEINKSNISQAFDFVWSLYHKDSDIVESNRLSPYIRSHYIIQGDSATIQEINYFRDNNINNIKVYLGLTGNVSGFFGSRAGLTDTYVVSEYVLNKNNNIIKTFAEDYIIKKEKAINNQIDIKEFSIPVVIDDLNEQDKLSLTLNIYDKTKTSLLDTRTIDIDIKNIKPVSQAPAFIADKNKQITNKNSYSSVINTIDLQTSLYLIVALLLFLFVILMLQRLNNKIEMSKKDPTLVISLKYKIIFSILAIILTILSLSIGFQKVYTQNAFTPMTSGVVFDFLKLQRETIVSRRFEDTPGHYFNVNVLTSFELVPQYGGVIRLNMLDSIALCVNGSPFDFTGVKFYLDNNLIYSTTQLNSSYFIDKERFAINKKHNLKVVVSYGDYWGTSHTYQIQRSVPFPNVNVDVERR